MRTTPVVQGLQKNRYTVRIQSAILASEDRIWAFSSTNFTVIQATICTYADNNEI